MPSPNKSYSIKAQKQKNIGGVGAASGFPGAALLSMWFTAAKVPGRGEVLIDPHLQMYVCGKLEDRGGLYNILLYLSTFCIWEFSKKSPCLD